MKERLTGLTSAILVAILEAKCPPLSSIADGGSSSGGGSGSGSGSSSSGSSSDSD